MSFEDSGTRGDQPLDFGATSDAASVPFGAVAPAFGTDGGSSDDNGDFDPSIHVGRDKRNADGSYRRKRGRRKGSGTSEKGTQKRGSIPHVDAINALTNALIVVHAGVSAMTKTPELALEKDDATTLARATANVLEQFDITPDPKVTAVVGLVMACGTVYGPRIYLIRERLISEARAKQEETQPAPVLHFNRGSNPVG